MLLCVVQELQNLLSKEEEQVREAQREKGAREKREEEERLLREKERREKATEQGGCLLVRVVRYAQYVPLITDKCFCSLSTF